MDDYKPLTSKEIERGYFFLTHKTLINKVLLGVEIFAVVVILVVFVANLIIFVQKASWQSTAASLAVSADWSTAHAQREPQAIVVSNAQSLSLGNRLHTLVAFVENPNIDMAAKQIKYRFLIDGQPLEEEETFLNPGENRMIIKTGYESSKPPSTVRLDVDVSEWRRFENDAPQINWEILDVRYISPTQEEVNGQDVIFPSRVKWWAQNVSLYDLWEVKFQVALFNGDKLIGVNETISKDFDSLQNKELEVVWLNDLPRVTKTEVYPVVNWLDYNNYKSLESQPKSGGPRTGL